jgi:homoserine kinase type II
MARLTPISLTEAKHLGQRFGVQLSEVTALDAGSVNSNFRLRASDGQVLFGRIYEEQDQAGAQTEQRLLIELAQAGIPTTLPLLPAAGESLPEHQGKPFALFHWVSGRDLCLGLVTTEKARILGRALAAVHQASVHLTRLPASRFSVPQLLERLEFIDSSTSRFTEAVQLIRQKLQYYAARVEPQINQGLVHGDLFPDNVLWKGDKIAALLDFESASWGPFGYDLMVCLLAWCYRDTFVIETAQALVEGYLEKRPLGSEEREQLLVQGALACLRFATTRITDFSLRAKQGQAPLRDYRRFLSRLAELEAGRLDSVLHIERPQAKERRDE